ncbi:MAG: hypothetical protein U0Q15_15150 [Kineosporiaceae bacterium]
MTAALAAALALGLVACGSGDGDGDGRAAEPHYRSACHADGDREVVIPGPDGQSTFAVTVGSGPRAVLLLHEAESDHCAWIDFARLVAGRGVQAWAIDSSSTPNSRSVGGSDPRPDLVRTAEYVRAHGAREVVLAGASMGGATALSVAGQVGAARVAALSAPDIWQGVDGVGGAKALTVPGLVLVGVADTDFTGPAQAMKAANPAHVTLVEVPTGGHGTSMLHYELDGRKVSEILAEFLLA